MIGVTWSLALGDVEEVDLHHLRPLAAEALHQRRAPVGARYQLGRPVPARVRALAEQRVVGHVVADGERDPVGAVPGDVARHRCPSSAPACDTMHVDAPACGPASRCRPAAARSPCRRSACWIATCASSSRHDQRVQPDARAEPARGSPPGRSWSTSSSPARLHLVLAAPSSSSRICRMRSSSAPITYRRAPRLERLEVEVGVGDQDPQLGGRVERRARHDHPGGAATCPGPGMPPAIVFRSIERSADQVAAQRPAERHRP